MVLAAGAGRRLRPLTDLVPKALCPVGNRPLLDLALDRVGAVTSAVAVNVHHHRDLVLAHLEAHPGVHVSDEEPAPLGTAGALGLLRPWIDGRGVLVHNVDAWSTADLAPFVDGWDGERPRLLVAPGLRVADAAPAADAAAVTFGPGVGILASLIPWTAVATLEPVPSGLYEVLWRESAEAGRLDVVAHRGPFVDAGTPWHYLEANLAAARHGVETHTADIHGSLVDPSAVVSGAAAAAMRESVVGAGATVAGALVRSVVWPAAEVGRGEQLREAVRAPGLTVVVCGG